MSNGIGRISGPLLKDNLTRNGVDLAFETDLLYLEVNDNKIGVNTDAPSRTLNIESSVKTIDLIVDTYIDAANVNLNTTSNFSTDVGKLYIDSNGEIVIPSIKTDDIQFDNNQIYSFTQNTDIEIRPTAKTVFGSNLDVTGNIHANGDITFDGSIIFGNNDQDSVTLFSDIKSDIVPDQTDTYDLGFEDGVANKRWKDLFVKSTNASLIYADSLIVAEDINYNLRFSNAYFVSTTGNNLNAGNHQNAPYRNIKHALSMTESGDTVFVFPGEYEEEFPLTVPQGVTVVGYNIRNTQVKPTELTKFNDAFLLNGETSVTDLTVRDFNYDSLNDTGYAFRFAPEFSVSSRSPYIQNVSVITQQTEGILVAGRGALVDGSAAMSTSKEASMLFHSCTFIVPGSTGLLMKNGVRVEWLNCFTYFADIGLHALNGTDGFADQGIRFGAEIRSIGSANVYGTFGAVADGDDTLMYLINHNFGYIGSGLDSSNDNTLLIQENETVELNSGKIYYTSQSQDGDFRVGDAFLVDFNKGQVSFDTSGISLNGLSTIFFQGTLDRTLLEPGRIETGDFLLEDNKIKTLTRDFDISSASDEITFIRDVNVSKNLNVIQNLSVDGNIFLGNQPLDTITINVDFTQDLFPKVTDIYDIGADLKRWKDFYVKTAYLQDIKIDDNEISTTLVDSDLNLNGNGTGGVKLEQLLFKNSTVSSYSNSNIKLTPNQGISQLTVIGISEQTVVTGNTITVNLVGGGTSTLEIIGVTYSGSDALIDVKGDFSNIQTYATPPSGLSITYTTNLVSDQVFTWPNSGIIEYLGGKFADGNDFNDAIWNDLITVGSTITVKWYYHPVAVNMGVVTQVDKGAFSFSNHFVYVTNPSNFDLPSYTSDNLTDHATEYFIVSEPTITFSGGQTGLYISEAVSNDKSLIISGTYGLRVPRTTTTLNLTGDLRFNTILNQYEGFSSALLTLGGIYSSDKRTSVLAHPTNNSFNFTTNLITNTTLNQTALNTVRFTSGNLVLDNNSLISTAGNISLLASSVNLGLVNFEDGTISSPLNQNLELTTVNQGYVQFSGDKAVALPAGTDLERPTNPIIGNTRFNSEQGYLETWNGTAWVSVAGEGDLADSEFASEATFIWSIALG